MTPLQRSERRVDSPSAPGRWLSIALGLAVLAVLAIPAPLLAGPHRARISNDLVRHLDGTAGEPVEVIVRGDRARLDALAARHGLEVRRLLKSGGVLRVPAAALAGLVADPALEQVSANAKVWSHLAVSAQATGADQAWAGLEALEIGAVTGRGVGIAIIDSGIARNAALAGRVVVNVDFTGPRGRGQDQFGHGTHVAGIVAGGGGVTGMAPGAYLLNLKVLGADGSGTVADVVEAIDWAIDHRGRYGIRILNLSLGGAVTQPAADDPLCQAVERAVQAGLVVVAAAGNVGRSEDGRTILGGITTPGNSPYAITAGALDSNGTPWRSDDSIAAFSSKGPTLFDRYIKPDLVAPGRRVESLLAPGSTLAREHPELVLGSGSGGSLRLSGTSMSAAVVSGAAALLLEANPRLGPFHVKMALQLSASRVGGAGLVWQGAGSLNVPGALAVAANGPRAQTGATIGGEAVTPFGVSYANVALTQSLDGIVWGGSDGIVWGGADGIVWGGSTLWGVSGQDSTIWGSSASDSIIWGNSDSIIWGNSDSIIWGNSDSIIWGN